MVNKCDNCNKSITKVLPGVECGKCERIVHLNTKCTGLSNKQIAALKAAPSLEWTCLQCQNEAPRRTSSIIVPDDEDDDDQDAIHINTKKLLNNITKEVERAINKEMKELNDSLQFHSAKLDEVVECIETFKKTIRTLERKNIELINKNTNLEIRVSVIEQRIQELEQEKLSKSVEIANVNIEKNDEVLKVVHNIANKLKQPIEDIATTKIIRGKTDQPSKLLMELKDEGSQERWILSSKTTKITMADVYHGQRNNNNPIYIREAMSKLNKQLFWNAKQELRNKLQFKYVWFKKGLLRARKDDMDKVYSIRNMNDLQAIVERYSRIHLGTE